MVRTGKDYLASIQDNRNVYLNGERIEDITMHPAFEGITKTFADLYDFAADETNEMTFETEGGIQANKSFLIPRSREDLEARRVAITKWAEKTSGFVGRSPDHVASVLAAFAGSTHIFERAGKRYADNVVNFYNYARDNDLFVTYVIIPPQIDRSKAAHEQEEKYLQAGVYEEKEDGIVIRGAMMLGTSSAVSNYLFVSCLVPLRAGDEDHAVSFVVPLDAPGLKLYARQGFATLKESTLDGPLSTRFDESDAMVMFDDVFIPWEHVFVYRDVELTRAQFHEAPAHVLGNNQAQIRLTTKLKFLAGVAKKITEMNGTDRFPQVQEKLGELASIAASVEGSLLASEYSYQTTENGLVHPNRRFVYGMVGMQEKLYPEAIKILRELSGGGVLQLPSSYRDLIDTEIKQDMYKLVRSSQGETLEKIKLFKLVWDIVGTEFGGRHQQYELFYNGAPYVVKGYAFRNYDYAKNVALVDTFLQAYSLPEENVTLV